MDKLYIVFKQPDCIQSNHYYSDRMSSYKGDYTDQVILVVCDDRLRVINWIYPSEFKQYNGTN